MKALLAVFFQMAILTGCSSYTTFYTLKPSFFEDEKDSVVSIEPLKYKRRDVVGILIPLVPIHKDYSKSSFVRIYWHSEVDSCPNLLVADDVVVSPSPTDKRLCEYSVLARPEIWYSIEFDGERKKWTYTLSIWSVYSPWIFW